MIISFDGNGNFNVVAADENTGGTLEQQQMPPGTYVVDTNGALTLSSEGTGGLPAGFLVSQNKALLVGAGSSSTFGMLEPQTGGPFANASVQGIYAGGSFASLDNANTADEVYTLSGAGGGTITANSASSDPGGLGLDLGGTVNYAIASNGRGTAQEGQGGKNQGMLYMISPTKFVVLLPQTAAGVLVFEH